MTDQSQKERPDFFVGASPTLWARRIGFAVDWTGKETTAKLHAHAVKQKRVTVTRIKTLPALS